MKHTILSRKELADRWGKNPTTIDDYERDGIIRRLNLPGANYSLASIELIEYDGIDNILKVKDREINKLKVEVYELRSLIEKLKFILNGV